ncbi:MAG: DEAD/DEAH box helicase [Archangium sp.]|nr:DEAD/DEAH box helicase [Archangium sp.]
MKSLGIALTPAGHVVLTEASPDVPVLDSDVAARVAKAWGDGAGLLHLGWSETETALPPDFAFWRDLSKAVVSAVCTTPGIEELRDKVEFAQTNEQLEAMAAASPPMTGGEYLNAAVLAALQQQVLEALREELRSTKKSVQELFASKSAAWHVVGKVHLHLAENKRDPERPFAFMASYTTGLSAQGKAQHRPLGDAVRDSSSARDKDRLLVLLLPIKRASERATFLKELVDSGKIFRPLAWTAREAHRFLQELPELEDSGVVVRVPDWWKARQPPRPVVSVSVGGKQPTAVGLFAMLDFSVQVSLGGEELTADELKLLRAGSEGLVLLKGKWVEVDRQKLDQVLAHWKTVREQAGDGISFLEGMRLLSGAAIEGTEELGAVREWSSVRAGPWLTQTLQALRAPGTADPGDALRAELRPYQRAGVQWLWLLSQLKLGACLADDMGLGKTVQVIALLLLMKKKAAVKGPHLLVVPASLIANWKAEASKFAPSLIVVVAHPSELRLSADEPAEVAAADVVITSYGTVHRVPWFKARRWGLVVLDEAQAIKNPGSQQTRAVKQLEGVVRIALTGTPVENRLGDLWSLFDFLNPGLLGSSKQFTAFVKKSTSFGPLRELTRPYILRRLKTDRSVISDLPEKTEMKAWCTLSKRQAALYQESVEKLAKELKQVDGIKRRGLVLSYLMRFKQLCNHPSQWLGDSRYATEESGKHERLQQLCEVIASRQEKVLVFTQFREMTLPLATWLEGVFGKPGLVLSGDTTVKSRQGLVKRFQEEEAVPFFVLSLKAGGTGLNLTAASHVIHFDRWWNPSVENQATDRAYRIGQKRNVLVHKFVCRGTIEERVDELIESKRRLSTELLEGGEELKLTELDDGALLKMVSLDLHTARSEA